MKAGKKRRVRMANLACVGSMAINGVAAMHTELLKKTVLKDFYEMWPEKFRTRPMGLRRAASLLWLIPRWPA